MRKLAWAAGASALVLAMTAGQASATPTDPPNCHGQSVAFLVQTYGSAAAAAAAFGVTVKDGQIMVRQFCSSGV